MEAAAGDATAEVPKNDLDRGRRKGRRPTRAEKGTYMGNQDFLREVRMGCSTACSALALCLLCRSIEALASCVNTSSSQECLHYCIHSCLNPSIKY